MAHYSTKSCDAKYIRRKYRVESTKRLWTKFLQLIPKVCILVTLFLIPVNLGCIVYFTFVCYDFFRVILHCIFLWLMIDSNLKLQ